MQDSNLLFLRQFVEDFAVLLWYLVVQVAAIKMQLPKSVVD